MELLSWSGQFTRLLDRVRAGESPARAELFSRLYDRLTGLAATVLTSFPAASGRHDVESIVHDLYLKMVAAFDAGQVPLNTTEFLRFAAFKLRNLLLDESRRAAVRRAKGLDEFDPGTSAGEPGLLAQWTEFHTRVGALPDDERQVVELCYYLGVSQAEVAEQLDIHPRKVSRLMASAVGKLEKYLPGHG